MKQGDCCASTLGAMVLFISTALLSQIVHLKLESKRRKEDRVLNMRSIYKTKRLADRLSYTDVTALNKGPARKSLRLSNGMDVLQPPTADEDAFDQIPKNSNWAHFESSNEDDFKEGIVTPIEGDDDVSSASSEAFLWTNGKQKRRTVPDDFPGPLKKNLKRSMSEPVKTTWLGRLKQTLSSVGDDVYAASSDQVDMEEKEELRHRHFWASQPISGARRSISTPDMSGMNNGDITHQNQSARAHYNARIMPDKVVMIRHGQSEGNVNEALYSTTPDNAMRLTKLGWDQARRAGEMLKEQVLTSGEPIHFIVSPYVRTVETFHGLVSAWCDPKEFDHILDREKRVKAWYGRLLELGLTWHEDPRIREQDFGNYQVPEKIKEAKNERHRFGPFFYRFAHGESASDVFDRVSTFLDSLWRSFDLNKSRNYVLVTHGISIRVLLSRYFRYSIDQFSLLANPRNCEMVVLGHDGAGKLQLDGRYEVEVGENKETGEKEVRGYTFHKRLRVLPKKYIHKLNVRISHDDNLRPPQMVGYDSVASIQDALLAADDDESKLEESSPRPEMLNHTKSSLG